MFTFLIFFSSAVIVSSECFRSINREMQMRAIGGARRYDRSAFHDLPLFHCASADFSHIALRSKVRIAESGARNVYLFMTYETPKENEGWPTFAADRATSVGGGISGHAGRIILRPSLSCKDLKFWMKNTCSRKTWHTTSRGTPILLSNCRRNVKVSRSQL